MQTKVIQAAEPSALSHAVDVLNHSGVVALPTDTVYGLAALASDTTGIERLYAIKGRNSAQAIAVMLGDAADLEKVSATPHEMVKQLVARFWPGPLTLVMPRLSSLPDILSPNETIGVRIPDHPVALELLKLTGPLAVTSANLSGRENAITADEVLEQLDGRVHLVLDGGRAPGGVASTVVDATAEELTILRPGPISEEDLLAALA